MGTIVTRAPKPGSEKHAKMITASKLPAILGNSPYQTTGALWMLMSGLADPEPIDAQTDEMFAFGHDAENALVKSWQRRNPGYRQFKRGEIAYSDETLEFPNLVTLDRVVEDKEGNLHILELKTSASFKKWGTPDDALPADVITQVIFQMGISGIHSASVVALVGGDRPLIPRFYEVEYNAAVFEKLCKVATEFYESLGNSVPPMPPVELLEAIAADRVKLETDKKAGEYDATGAPEFDELKAIDNEIAALARKRDSCAEKLLKKSKNKPIVIDGKKITKRSSGRFAQSRVPADAAHLLKDKECFAPKFNAALFKKKYPEVHDAAVDGDTITIANQADPTE